MFNPFTWHECELELKFPVGILAQGESQARKISQACSWIQHSTKYCSSWLNKTVRTRLKFMGLGSPLPGHRGRWDWAVRFDYLSIFGGCVGAPITFTLHRLSRKEESWGNIYSSISRASQFSGKPCGIRSVSLLTRRAGHLVYAVVILAVQKKFFLPLFPRHSLTYSQRTSLFKGLCIQSQISIGY